MGSECSSEQSCGDKKQDCGSDECCDMAKEMMNLANQAWAELMKEKMKKEFEKVNGERMNKIAAVGVAGCNDFWQHKMQAKAGCADFSEKLKQAFMG